MTGIRQDLEIRGAWPGVADALGQFFQDLRDAGDEHWFHPHPLTREAAEAIATYTGPDVYSVLLAGGSVVGYGMLRGWSEGFATPSLGIAIHPTARGRGVARALMLFLHAAAVYRGAKDVRLSVSRENTGAIRLYESLGYRLEPLGEDRLVGHLRLHTEHGTVAPLGGEAG